MIQIHTLKSEATDGHSYSCEKVGNGKNGKKAKQDKPFHAKVSVPPKYLSLLLKCREVEQQDIPQQQIKT